MARFGFAISRLLFSASFEPGEKAIYQDCRCSKLCEEYVGTAAEAGRLITDSTPMEGRGEIRRTKLATNFHIVGNRLTLLNEKRIFIFYSFSHFFLYLRLTYFFFLGTFSFCSSRSIYRFAIFVF